MENWKKIKDFEDLYEVSNIGRVRRKTTKRLIKPSIVGNRVKYYQVQLYRNKKRTHVYVHRLVYQAFIGELQKDLQVDHIDNNPFNNCVNNLQQLDNRANSSKDKTDVGINWDKGKQSWLARIRIDGKLKFLGRRKDKQEALQ